MEIRFYPNVNIGLIGYKMRIAVPIQFHQLFTADDEDRKVGVPVRVGGHFDVVLRAERDLTMDADVLGVAENQTSA